jgi:hypothetical protein
MIQINAPRIRNLGLTWALAIVLLLILGFTMASPGRSASSASGLAAQATCTTIIDDHVVTHTTWTVAGSPYCVQMQTLVDDGITLTIEAGVTVYFSETLLGETTSLYVAGSLVAAGTPTQPITFTSIKTMPQPGDWDHIKVISGSHAHLAYCDIGYAGTPGLRAAVEIHSPDVFIDHCTIHDTGNNLPALGLFGSDTRTTIQNTVIRNNSGYAIYQEMADMTPVYRNLTLTDNMTDAVYIAMSMVNGRVTLDGKELGGKPFIIVNVTVGSSGVLTLSPGTEVRLGYIGVNPDGTLSAAGTATQPITMTSVHPSVFGGGLSFERGSTAHLAYCDISRVGEMGHWAAVDIGSSDVVIENSRIHDNYANGIYIAGDWGGFAPRPTLRVNQIYNHSGVGLQVDRARPVLQGNAFNDNAEYAVENKSVPFADVDARHQWWGHASGPGHPTANPGGLGDRVSDGVVFVPWLAAPGNRLPTIQMVWPPDGATFSELPITLTMVASDPDEWQPLYFRVEILSDTTVIATFDQTVNAFGWDRPSYSSGVTATLALSQALANGAYSWRAAVFDGFGFVPAAEERAFQVDVSGMKVSALEPAEIIATANQTLTLRVYGMGFTHTAQVWLEQDHGGGNIERLDPVQVQVVSAEQITLGVNLTGRSGPWDVVVSQEGATKRARLYAFPYMPLMAIEYWNPQFARLVVPVAHQLQLTNRGTAPGVGIVGLVVPTGTAVLTDCLGSAVEYLGQPTARFHLLAVPVQRGETRRVPLCYSIPWDFGIDTPLRFRFWVLAQPTPETWQALKQGAAGNLEQLIGGAIQESALTEGLANDRYLALANGTIAGEYIERLGAQYPYVANALVSRQLLDFQLAVMAALGRDLPGSQTTQGYGGLGLSLASEGSWDALRDNFVRAPWETTKLFLTGCYEGIQSGQAGSVLLAEFEGFIGGATFGLWRPDLGAATAAHVTGLDPAGLEAGRPIGEILNYIKTGYTVGKIAKWGYGTLVSSGVLRPFAASGASCTPMDVSAQDVLHPSISVLWGENYLVQWGDTAGAGPHWGIAWTSEAITSTEPIVPAVRFVVDGHIYRYANSIPYDWPRWSDFGARVRRIGEVPADVWLQGGGTDPADPVLPPGPPHDPSACNPGSAITAASHDPNDIEGMPRLSHIRSTQPLEFLIRFENVHTATLPAETVTVTLPIHPNLDWESIRLLGVSHPVSLSVKADEVARTLTWQFADINLPPNKNPPEGEGWIRLKVNPDPTLTTGQQITAQATIRFDANPPMDTNVLTYTIDLEGPTSVLSVKEVTGPVASLWVTATDNAGGIGVSSVAVYYSQDGAHWALGAVLTSTTPSEVLSGVVAFTAPGGTYMLQASAVDRLGNFGARSASAQVALPYRVYLPVVLRNTP